MALSGTVSEMQRLWPKNRNSCILSNLVESDAVRNFTKPFSSVEMDGLYKRAKEFWQHVKVASM